MTEFEARLHDHDRQVPRCRNCGGAHPDDCLGPYCDRCLMTMLSDRLRDLCELGGYQKPWSRGGPEPPKG